MCFDEWWDANEDQFMVDSMHMSEYHMASVVWNAAIDQCATVCEVDAPLNDGITCAELIRELEL